MTSNWYLYKDGHQQGPFSWEDLYRQVEAGAFGPADLVWTEGMANWTRADQVEGLFRTAPSTPVDYPNQIMEGPVNQDGINGTGYTRTSQKKGMVKVIAISAVVLVFLAIGAFIAYKVATDKLGEHEKSLTAGDPSYYNVGDVKFTMRYVPAATFPTGLDDDGQATVEYPYWLGETGVTYELWYEVRTWAENNGYKFANQGREGSHGNTGREPSDNRNQPVTKINWYDAVVWCNALSEILAFNSVYVYQGEVYRDSTDRLAGDNLAMEKSIGFRLPTIYEWELAARYKGSDSSHGAIEYPPGSGQYWTPGNYASGAKGPYSNEKATMAAAWYLENSDLDGSGPSSQPVGQKPAGGTYLNLYDMSGNVYEWFFFSKGEDLISFGGSYEQGADRQMIGYQTEATTAGTSISPQHSYFNCGFRVLIPVEAEILSANHFDEPENDEPFPVTSLVEVEWEGEWYNAQVLKIEENSYYITYLDYDSSWDEWVNASRIRKRTKEPEIESVQEVRFTVDHGANLLEAGLPETIQVILEDGSTFHSSVSWDASDLVSAETGEYLITGNFENLPINLSNPEKINPVLRLRVIESNGHASLLRQGGETNLDGLLFYIENDEGIYGYYYGLDSTMELTHMVVENNDTFVGMVIYNADMYPVQWVFPDLTIAVTIPRDNIFNPQEAIHFFVFEEEQIDFTLDIEMNDTVELVMEKMLGNFGHELSGSVQLLKEEFRTKGWLTKTVAEVAVIADTPHEISLASMLSMVCVGIRIIDQLESIAEASTSKDDERLKDASLSFIENELIITMLSTRERVIESLLQEIAKEIIKLGRVQMGGMVVPMLSYLMRIASGYYDGLDIEGPAVSMLLCKGATTVPKICHEFYMPNTPGNISRCTKICLTSLACFTDICHPKMFSVEDAFNLLQPFKSQQP